jgi:hypothetical protein
MQIVSAPTSRGSVPLSCPYIARFQDYIRAEYSGRSKHWACAKSLIEAVAERLAETACPLGDWVDLLPVARQLRVKVTFAPCRPPKGGMLLPEEHGFSAAIDGRPDQPRARFTLAHEFGHVFFYDLEQVPPQPFFFHAAEGREARREEGLCDAFAAALLLPLRFFTAEVDQAASMNYLVAQAVRRRVSVEVFLRRVLHGVGWLRCCSFYAVSQRTPPGIRVRRFVGLDVQRTGIRAAELADRLAHCSPAELCSALASHLGDRADVFRGASTTWVKVAG